MNPLLVQQNAEDRDRLAAEYSTLSTRFGELEGMLAVEWLNTRALYPEETDKTIDKRLGASKIGQEHSKLKYMLKGMEKRISSLNTIIQVANNEARNQY